MLFEILIPLNTLVTVVYWSMLMQTVTGGCIAEPGIGGYNICVLHSYTVHSLPLICCLLDYSVTDVIVKARHSLSLIPIGICYMYWNYHVTTTTGVPVYWFFDWKDHKTPALGFIWTLCTMGFFCLMSWTTKVIRSFRRKAFKLH